MEWKVLQMTLLGKTSSACLAMLLLKVTYRNLLSDHFSAYLTRVEVFPVPEEAKSKGGDPLTRNNGSHRCYNRVPPMPISLLVWDQTVASFPVLMKTKNGAVKGAADSRQSHLGWGSRPCSSKGATSVCSSACVGNTDLIGCAG